MGYYIDKDKHYKIDKDTAPIVAKIFEMYAGGSTVKQIEVGGSFLNDVGSPTFPEPQTARFTAGLRFLYG